MPPLRPLHERVPAAQALRWMNVKRRSRLKRHIPWQKLLARVEAPHEPTGAARFGAWTREKIGARSQPRPAQGVFEVKLKGRKLLFTVGVGRDLRERAVKRARVRRDTEFVGGREGARQRVLQELGVDALQAVARPPVLGRGRTAFLAEGRIAWDEALARHVARQAAHGFKSVPALGETEIAEFVSSALKAYEDALLERKQRERLRAERAVRREVGPGTQEVSVNGGGRTDAPASKAPSNGGNGAQARNPLKRRKRNGAATKPAAPLPRRQRLALAKGHFYKSYEEDLEWMRGHRPRLVQQVVDRNSPTNQFIRRVLDKALPRTAAANLELRRQYAWGVVKLLWVAGQVNRNFHPDLQYFIEESGARHAPGNHVWAVVEQVVKEGVIVQRPGKSKEDYKFNYEHPIMRTVQG